MLLRAVPAVATRLPLEATTSLPGLPLKENPTSLGLAPTITLPVTDRYPVLSPGWPAYVIAMYVYLAPAVSPPSLNTLLPAIVDPAPPAVAVMPNHAPEPRLAPKSSM